jgi:uncharacterized iron-regulated membrane protein
MARGMASQSLMRTLAQWHVWLGWLVGVPIVMWLATGLLMVSRPIEEVRGEHLRREVPPAPLVLSGSALAEYDALLAENDQDLIQWVLGQSAPPARFAALIAQIAAHARGRLLPGL